MYKFFKTKNGFHYLKNSETGNNVVPTKNAPLHQRDIIVALMSDEYIELENSDSPLSLFHFPEGIELDITPLNTLNKEEIKEKFPHYLI